MAVQLPVPGELGGDVLAAAPLALLAAAILVTFVLLALEVAADKTIDSGPKYLRQKLLHLKDGRLGAKVDPQLR